MAGIEGRAVGAENHCALDGVAQLAGVAGPVVGSSCGRALKKPARKRLRPCFWFISVTIASAIAARFFDVLAESRHVDVEDVEAVVEIGAQVALFNGDAGIAIGGGEDAHVHLLLGARAQAAELALLKNAQELGLGGDGHFADLVEQQGAAGGQLEASGTPFGRAGEGAFFVAEELAFDEGLRDGGAVDGDEGTGFARS